MVKILIGRVQGIKSDTVSKEQGWLIIVEGCWMEWDTCAKAEIGEYFKIIACEQGSIILLLLFKPIMNAMV